MAALRSILFMLVFYAGSAFYVLAAPLAAAFGRRALAAHVLRWVRFHDRCARMLLDIRMKIEGELPPGPLLVAMKHEAMYETLQAVLLLDRPAIVAKRELADIPVWGWTARRYGVIVVDREAGGQAMRHMLKDARAAVADGRSVLIFPEGTRVPHGEEPPLRPGFAGLYRALNLPVVPVAVDSGRLLPRDSWIKRAGVVHFKVGEPIPPGLSREAVEARVHEAINVLNPPLR